MVYASNRNLAEISTLTHTVVCDFRVQDVQLGGQGSISILVIKIFSEYDYCMNLGGFSIFPCRKKTAVAFDISPVNTVLNHYQ
jgi:anhydro-N-acetylmuramic acid kinase